MIPVSKLFGHPASHPSKTILPLLPLRDIVVFPQMVAPLFVGRKKSVKALTEAMNKDKRVFLATQKKAAVDTPEKSDICEMGTIGKVLQLLKLPDGTVKALVEGEARGRILHFIGDEEFFEVEIEAVAETPLSETARVALTRALPSQVQVWRDGQLSFLPVEELVAGDRLLLEEGDKVPADARDVLVVIQVAR